ncbi:OsmC family protein [Bacillus sp. ISL-47]|uniref:OsmC family protein n=1 Tax=Bacillus sp. ISL-47 TaxID=2819130 RepID=UPI001BEB4E30|nr:OsmC family protein [Bacillus sp. ISL-47]MBT2688674.1 OsmC family protein [Bacillus sp. ISL-47]MBT2709980.1 OsmC family protein [Pseudomonas sp. ISL-84]
MVGTLAGALEAREIPITREKLQADVQGVIEAPEGVLKITTIRTKFKLLIPKGKKEAAERALNVFEKACPVAQTLKGAINLENTWEITEE